MTRQQLNPYIRRLKKSRVIEKGGYCSWIVNEAFSNVEALKTSKAFADGIGKKNVFVHEHDNTPYPEDFTRGHGYEFRLALPVRWEKELRRQCLDAYDIAWEPTGTPTWQGEKLTIDGWTVWLTPRSIISWFPKNLSIYSEDAADCFIEAIYRWKENVVKKLESLFRRSFKINDYYSIKVSAEHHAMIKNAEARSLRHKKKKLYIWDHEGELRMISDYSLNEDELEFVKAGKSTTDEDRYKRFQLGVIETGITPEFIMKSLHESSVQIGQFAQGMQQYGEKGALYAENIALHMGAITELKGTTGNLDKTTETLNQTGKALEKGVETLGKSVSILAKKIEEFGTVQKERVKRKESRLQAQGQPELWRWMS